MSFFRERPGTHENNAGDSRTVEATPRNGQVEAISGLEQADSRQVHANPPRRKPVPDPSWYMARWNSGSNSSSPEPDLPCSRRPGGSFRHRPPGRQEWRISAATRPSGNVSRETIARPPATPARPVPSTRFRTRDHAGSAASSRSLASLRIGGAPVGEPRARGHDPRARTRSGISGRASPGGAGARAGSAGRPPTTGRSRRGHRRRRLPRPPA